MFQCLIEGNGRVANIRQVEGYHWVIDLTIGEDQKQSFTEKYRHLAFGRALKWIDLGLTR